MAIVILLVGLGLGYLTWLVAQGRLDAGWLHGGLRISPAEAQVKGRRARATLPPPAGLAVYMPQPGDQPGAGWYRPGLPQETVHHPGAAPLAPHAYQEGGSGPITGPQAPLT